MTMRAVQAARQQWRMFLALPAAIRRRFVVMALPWLLAFLLGFPILWTQFGVVAQAPLWRATENLRDESAEIVRRTLDSLEHDAMFLSDLSSQMPRTDTSADSPMARLFLSFAKTAGAYGVVRWLDRDGNERMRVNARDGVPVLVGDRDLQNQGARPYFKDTVGLPSGSIYFSQLTLNVENGVVEQPLEPTLRGATPLYDSNGSRGVIVINYRANRLFDRLMDLGLRQGLDVYLVNDEGYWLQGPTPEESWAWQLGKPDRALSNTNPAFWKAMQQADFGRYSDAAGDWAFRRIKLNVEASADRDTGGPLVSKLGLRVLVHSSREQAAQADSRWKYLLAPFMALVFFFAVRYGWHTVSKLMEEHRQANELQAANQALTQANDNLRSVQADLSRAERLSSLGLMVAGVAHELNTPLGSASLSLSTMQQTISTLLGQLDTGLRRSDLDAFVSSTRLATELAQAAVQRAAGIVQRFKQVAVDRTIMERREFDLAEVILDADPRLARWDAGHGILLQLELEPGLLMNSYPGPLEQVVSNLLGNALTHAFRGREHGRITVQALADGPLHAIVRISDDGVGIDNANLAHVFDPFFTTNRHAGGTGLGLHIVSQLVAEVLAGTINVQSRTTNGSSGTVFTLRLPRLAPSGRQQPAPPVLA